MPQNSKNIETTIPVLIAGSHGQSVVARSVPCSGKRNVGCEVKK